MDNERRVYSHRGSPARRELYRYPYANVFNDDYGPRDPQRTRTGDDPYCVKPVTTRIGAGRRARIAVETGGTNATDDAAKKYELERRQRELVEARERAKYQAKRQYEAMRKPPAVATRRYQETRPPAPRRNSSKSSTMADDGAVILDPVPPEQPGEVPATGSRPSSPAPSSVSAYSGFYADEGDLDFKLPLKPQAVTYDYLEDVSFPLETKSSDDSGRRSQGTKSKFSGPITEVSILQSRWLGSAYDRGDLSADISTPSTPASQGEKHQEALLKWYHLERATMSLEEFIAVAQSIPKISEQKRREISKLLRDVQKKFEKQRQHGRDLEPDCVSDVFVGDSSSRKSACVTFICFPYFCLEPYDAAQYKNLTPGTPMHPLRPLLQAHFHSTSQRRELAQAITNFPTTGDNTCLQLSQVWCLILDGDTMLTCSRQSHDALCDQTISKSSMPTTDDGTSIRVSLGNDRSWLVPVDDKTTWPSFLAVFGESLASLESDGVAANFKVNGDVVNAQQWPSLLEVAKTGAIGLDLQEVVLQPVLWIQETTITAKVGGESVFDDRGKASAESSAQNVQSKAPAEAAVGPEGRRANEGPSSLQIFTHASDTDLESLADSLGSVLRLNEREKEKEAYNQGAMTNLFAIGKWVQTNDAASQNIFAGLIGPAIYLFHFFWPSTFDHPLAQKYWGAVDRIVNQDTKMGRGINVEGFLADLNDNVIPLMESLAQEFKTSPADLRPLPDAYSKAFLHLIMAFVLLSQTAKQKGFGINNSTIRAHIRGLKEELNRGKREITARLKRQAPDLEDLEICSHISLLALILNKFSQDIMHGKPDVASTYNDYFYQLDFRITEDPTPRSHQETLRFFLQEVEAILSTLQYQFSVMEAFEQTLKQQQQVFAGRATGSDNFLLRYALGESRQQVVIDECKARIASRIDKFRGLQQRAEDLGEWHRNEMETNRDRQENAIMVFTIVTIIFLPLSFVSSVFGMNTSDIRDMEVAQWAYWAAGVPLTVLVLVGSLWWAGEFEGFGKWVQRTLTRASRARGYQRIPEPVAYGDRRRERREVDVQYAGGYVYDDIPTAGRRRTTYPRRRYR